MSHDQSPAPQLGRALREYFQFSPSYTPINHGSYGTWPKPVREVHRGLEEDLEARPDWYLAYEYPRLLKESRQAVAQLVHANEEDVVLVQNATTAYNTVLRSMVWQPGDYVLHYDLVYGSLSNTIKYLEETTPLRSRKINLTFPCSDDDLVQSFDEAIREIRCAGHNPRMAVFDTIASMPGIRIPFERIVQKCKEHQVLSLIDGAHGIGHIPLDLNTLDADFFLSNLHKWLFVPRGCAVLHVPKRNQALIRSTLPTSHSFQPRELQEKLSQISITDDAGDDDPVTLPPFVALFEFVGSVSSQNYLTVPAALKFRQQICGGEEAIREYCFSLARDGGQRAAEILGTREMEHEASCMRECAFSNVLLPLEIGAGKGQVRPDDLAAVREFFFYESTATHDMYLQTIAYNNAIWLRLSAQVYLEVQDFERAAEAAKQVCEVIRSGQLVRKGPLLRRKDEQ